MYTILNGKVFNDNDSGVEKVAFIQ